MRNRYCFKFHIVLSKSSKIKYKQNHNSDKQKLNLMATTQNRKIQSLETDKLSESLKSYRWPANQDSRHQAAYASYDPVNHENKQTYYNAEVRHSNHQVRTQNEEVYHQPIENSERNVQYEFSFKKNKSKDSQINRLLELKQEYEILKNMNVEQSMIYTHKSNREQSMDESSVKSQITSSKKSLKSDHMESKSKHIVQYEKKQLEIMLNNSMNKVEQLLKNQIEYKRKIHELSNRSFDRSEIEELMRVHKKEQTQLLETIDSLRKEQEHLRETNKKLSQKIGLIEADLAGKQIEHRKMSEQRNKLEEEVYLNREKLLMGEIQIKRVKMESEILEKDKNSQISYLKRLVEDSKNHIFSKDDSQLEKLREQIKLKDYRYDLLLSQLEMLKKAPAASPKTDKTQTIFQELLLKLEASQQPNSESSILQEIRLLKQHLESRRGDQDLENKIRQLEKIIDEQNIEKAKFMEELRSMSTDYDRIYSENMGLKQKNRELEVQLRKLKKQLYGAKEELEMSHHAKLQLSISREQNTEYISKTIQKLEQENRDLIAQYDSLKLSSKEQVNEFEDQIRKLRRECDECKFKIEKLIKENQFNLQLANSKALSETDLLNKEIGRLINQRDEWKRQFDNMKAFYERKLNQLRNQTQQFNEEWHRKITSRQQQLAKTRSDNQANLNNLRSRYQNDQSSLMNRLDSLSESNQRLAKQNARFMHMESQLYELKQQTRRMYQLNTNIDHLWSIKQTQFANVNDIIRSLQ